jgi:hypothetical protein
LSLEIVNIQKLPQINQNESSSNFHWIVIMCY